MIKNWEKEFIKYHNANPHMWAAYCKFAKQAYDSAIAHNRTPKFSTKLLNERIRWEDMMSASPGTYITTNSLTAYYARLLMWKFPKYRGCMRLKRISIDGINNDIYDVSTWDATYWNQF